MASPFSVFRRNQKLMFAILGIMVMFAFVFLPILGDSLGMRSRGIENKVVVKTAKYGDLRESDVERLRHQRQKILMVLGNVMQSSGLSPSVVQQFLMSNIGPATEESVANAWLLARHAQELGVVVGDESILRFLKRITQDRVKTDSFQAAFKQAAISERQFLGAMRDELAALELRQMSTFSLYGLTPAQRWDYFKRAKQLAKIEAAAVPVAGYVGRVDDPGDEELKKFFEEHKEKYPLPASSDPGFREPQRIALEYFKADVEQFTKKVTDDEIKQRYEKNKDAYDEAEKKAQSMMPTEPSTKDGKDVKDGKANSTDAAKSEPAKKPTEPKQSLKATEPPKAQEPTKNEKQQDESGKKSKGTSAVSRPSPFRLTALQQEEKATDKAAVKAETAAGKTADKKPEEPKKEPADKKTPEKQPAAPEKKPETPEKKPQATPSAAKAGPSDKIKDRIRQEIAYEKIQSLLGKLRAPMDEYQRQWNKYEVNRIAAESAAKDGKNKVELPTPPEKPDFDKLAKQYGLSADRTDLMSQWEARTTDVGSSWVQMQEPVYRYAFASLSKFRAAESIGLKGDIFLFWKTQDEKERTAEFTDSGVRDRVLAAWKLVKARPLALEHAQSLAAEAAKGHKPLKQAFADQPDVKVVTPPWFSWVTTGTVPLGSAPDAVRPSEVEGVSLPGDDFMRAVFRLEKPGDADAAFNEPKNVAYVIRLVESKPSEEVLWKEFEVDDFSKYAAAAQNDRFHMYQAWMDEIKNSAGFHWERNPIQLGEVGSGESE